MAKSSIEWTESTWNPLTGCTKVSDGCKHCYAERMSRRLKAMGQANYANGFKLTMHPHVLEKPLLWKSPQMIFVNSMSDLFHSEVPAPFILQVFDVMRRAHWHTFQVLTKRAKRLPDLIRKSTGLPMSGWESVSKTKAYNGASIACRKRTPEPNSCRSSRCLAPYPT